MAPPDADFFLFAPLTVSCSQAQLLPNRPFSLRLSRVIREEARLLRVSLTAVKRKMQSLMAESDVDSELQASRRRRRRLLLLNLTHQRNLALSALLILLNEKKKLKVLQA